MSLARNLARLFPNASGLLPNANIEAMAANKLTGQVPDANAPSGSVIQVAEATRSTEFSFTTVHPTYTQYVSGAITTTIANSRILICANVPCYHSSAGGWGSSGYHRMKENGTIISGYEHPGVLNLSEVAEMLHFQYLTSAKSVGTYTYTLEGAITDIGGTMRIARNAGSQSSVRLLMLEIAP
jgi:hypothetical protein